MKKASYILAKIETADQKLCEVENNLQYIKVLQSLKLWLTRFFFLCDDETIRNQYNQEYNKYFCGGFFSFFDRVQNSILEYEYGNRPF